MYILKLLILGHILMSPSVFIGYVLLALDSML